MFERLILASALVVLAVTAYRLVLAYQRRRVLAAAGSTGGTGRSALLVFTSPTCAPCKYHQLPIVERLMADWRDHIDVRVIDVSEQPDAARQYGIWSVPTTVVLDSRQQVVGLNVGVAEEAKLRGQFERAMQPG